MKSAHRHQLETNVLAHRLEAYIQRYRPYTSTIAGVLIAVVVLMLVWSYLSSSSAARRSEAWDTYNHALGSTPPNLDEIHRTAQDYPGTPMQQMADVTWADGQVWLASRSYLDNRKAAMDALDRATSAYQNIIQSSKDERLTSRARLGLARVYEMQNHLDKAREQYRQVTGTYADYAKAQAARLEAPDTQETAAWLATAEPPRPKAPIGPGTPGQRPEFSPGEIALPGAAESKAGNAEEGKGAAESFESLFKNAPQGAKDKDAGERYKTDQPPAKESTGNPPVKDANSPEPKGAAAPVSDGATGNKPAESPPAESPPATEKPAK